MRTRTRLTTPPGQEPAPAPSETSSTAADDGTSEHYVPAFALPEEPRAPSRFRKLFIVVSVLVVVVISGYAILQVVTAGEDFDPAVGQDPGTQQPAGDDQG